MNKNIILFDLDGTLTDPKIGITKSVQHALRSFGINIEDLDQLCPFIGPPLRDSFMEYYGFTSAEAEHATEKFREHFQDIGIFENQVYEGIEDLLRQLQNSGKQLMLATSKPEVYAKRILAHFQLDQYFAFIGGGTLDGTREEKDEVIRYVLENGQVTKKDEVIMVGDRKFDIIGARKNQLQSIGVLYGYGDLQELNEAGADFIAETVGQLKGLLME